MTTAAPILDCFESLQAAVAEFLKHARNGGCGVLSDDDFVDLTRELEAIRVELGTADYPIVAKLMSATWPSGTRLVTRRCFCQGCGASLPMRRRRACVRPNNSARG